ncbi:hypothetical protein LPA44_16105 [Halobacterium sp. KA-4]|uniref:hypothetical protein n=1 Tax=Halobacterium sp. KA-4 TaxID=2896367 RepID=UPI001E5E68D7|nr:hypothetical protein [Halobacterium sp. KA-4]MCD2201394.1 hypothetical protein [Halobacterium sp. KA-4]
MYGEKDLTNFIDGLDELEGKERVMADISRWASSSQVDIFWRLDTNRYPSFTPVGKPEPDMLINSAKELYAVCVVHGEGNSESIREAFCKAVNIWERMVTDPPKYKQENIDRVPSAVLVATEQSLNGHLFSGDRNREHFVEFSEDRQEAADRGFLPQREFAATQEATRSAWAFTKDRGESDKTGVGALLSSRLDNKEDNQNEDPSPAAFYYLAGESQPHRWESIPWFR